MIAPDHFILKRILHKYELDHEVDCTADGEEVLEFLKQNRLILQGNKKM
jgi:hypothetical protein